MSGGPRAPPALSLERAARREGDGAADARSREEAAAAGDAVRVVFHLPGDDAPTIVHDFGGGMEVFFLKHWLQEAEGFDERTVSVRACNADASEPRPMLDILSLIDLPGIRPGATLHVLVEGEREAPRDEDADAGAAAAAAATATVPVDADAERLHDGEDEEDES
jgi:hypothetical protein